MVSNFPASVTNSPDSELSFMGSTVTFSDSPSTLPAFATTFLNSSETFHDLAYSFSDSAASFLDFPYLAAIVRGSKFPQTGFSRIGSVFDGIQSTFFLDFHN